MQTYNIHEAKTHLSKLIRDVEAGRPFRIARNGIVVAEVYQPKKGKRPLGLLEGKVPFDWDRWNATDEEIRKEFEASIDKPLF